MKPKDKREVPFLALQKVTDFFNMDKGRFPQVETADAWCLITDPNPASDFFFKVQNVTIHPNQNQTVIFSVVRKPYNAITTDVMENSFEITGLVDEFKNWVKLVDGYEALVKTEKDTILEGYEEEYFQAFELVDEDADEHSYPFPVQKLLDVYFEKLTGRLEEYKATNNLSEAKQATVDLIIQEVEELQETQTELSKQKVLTRLSSIWAKMRKMSLKLLEEAKTELIKEVIKQGAKGLLENPQAPVDFVINMFSGS